MKRLTSIARGNAGAIPESKCAVIKLFRNVSPMGVPDRSNSETRSTEGSAGTSDAIYTTLLHVLDSVLKSCFACVSAIPIFFSPSDRIRANEHTRNQNKRKEGLT